MAVDGLEGLDSQVPLDGRLLPAVPEPRPVRSLPPIPGAPSTRRVGSTDPIAVLPDITAVFGDLTYLASEIAFGAVAFYLLYRADALRRAARTIAALYPIAYIWDWYTLEIGVFAIQRRTGVDLLGIPLEEHLFIVVVPGFVLGLHETLLARDDRQ